jgi:acyl carrier protein
MDNLTQIEDRIRQFIVQNLYFVEDEVIPSDASFLETGVVDSTGVAELVAFVQSEFAIKVEAHEILVQNFDSIQKLASYVQRKLGPVILPAALAGVAPARANS